MENCKKCGNEFIPQKGLINYCSFSCRNSRNWTEDDKKKKSISAKKSKKVQESVSNARKYANTDNVIKKRKINYNKKLLLESFDELSYEKKRYRVKLEQEWKCNKCKLDTWLGEKLVLEFEHIDGNNNNNDRKNLEALCPNCHSLTKTWRGRNKSLKKVKDEILLKSLNENNNIRQALISVGLSPKGGNYKRCYALINKIPL